MKTLSNKLILKNNIDCYWNQLRRQKPTGRYVSYSGYMCIIVRLSAPTKAPLHGIDLHIYIYIYYTNNMLKISLDDSVLFEDRAKKASKCMHR